MNLNLPTGRLEIKKPLHQTVKNKATNYDFFIENQQK